MRRIVWTLALCGTLAACSSDGADTSAAEKADRPFTVAERGRFDAPWAMTFLPGTDLLAITEKPGKLKLRNQRTGRVTGVRGVPKPVVEGQGGLGDVIAGPTFTRDRTVYLSWIVAGKGGSGAVVGRARLRLGSRPALERLRVIWRQSPKMSGSGHFSHRLAISPDKRYLFVSSGDRQHFDPAQDLSNNLGSIVRLRLDGTAAPGNPFWSRGGLSRQVWSYGHRNALGIAFDARGRLWSSEMGPKGGDEINLIRRGKNYGWPKASNGSHYDGTGIPNHKPGDGFEAPKVWWNPSVSPGSLMIYQGKAFPKWRGDAFAGALSGQALLRIDLDGTRARKGNQWDMGTRIREVEQGPTGTIWLLEDGPDGRLMELRPRG